MANIRIDLDHVPYDGERIIFKAPCDASDVTGLKFYYGSTSAVFTLCDAHGDDVGNIDDVFADEALVTVILEIETNSNKAFIQNADTNAYLEGRFDGKADASHTHSASDITSGALADARIASASIWNAKQDALVSGSNIKTINSITLLESGNINLAPAYQYSTTDLTAGSSPLATGTLYFVYE